MHRKTLTLMCIASVVIAMKSFSSTPDTSAAVRAIHGRVLEVGAAAPVAEVQVSIAGVPVGTKTGAKGAFQLSNVPSGATQLAFRHPCYFPVQVTIPAEGDVAVSIGLPFDQASLRRPGCGGLGARKPDSTAH